MNNKRSDRGNDHESRYSRKRPCCEGSSSVLYPFVRWVQEEGARMCALLDIRHSPDRGFHVIASQCIPANEEIFHIPVELCFTSQAAQTHAVLSPHIKALDTCVDLSGILNKKTMNRAFVYAMLVYEASLGTESRWHHYITILPELRDFEVSVATCVKSERALSLLNDTRMSSVISRFNDELDIVFEKFFVPLLSRVFGGNSGSTPIEREYWLSRSALQWAATVYWSRAILIPTGTGEVEALVPLLDILNHKPGTLSSLQLSGKHESTQILKYSVGRTISIGEEICLNYGARGNEELLAYFGFTLEDNLADVVTIELSGNEDFGKFSVVLYRGSGVPSSLLEYARSQCHSGSKSTSGNTVGPALPILNQNDDSSISASENNILHIVYDVPKQPEFGSEEWRLDLDRDYSIDDTFVDFEGLGNIRSRDNEVAALNWLDTLFRSEVMRISSHSMTIYEAELRGEGCWSVFMENCRRYRTGQIRVLNSALSFINQLISSIRH